MSPRIRPVAEPYPPATAELIHQMTAPGRPTLALFTTLARNTALADAAHRMGSCQLSRRLSLSLRDREIVIDRTCARLGCEYEWGVHVAHFAARAALSGDQTRSGSQPRCTGARQSRRGHRACRGRRGRLRRAEPVHGR